MWNAVVERLKEPSTYAGIAFLAGIAGVHITPEAWTGVVTVASTIAGLAAIVIPEASAK